MLRRDQQEVKGRQAGLQVLPHRSAMYEEALMEIWINVVEAVLLAVFVVIGLLRVLRQGSRNSDFRMLVEVESAKRKAKEGHPTSPAPDEQLPPC